MDNQHPRYDNQQENLPIPYDDELATLFARVDTQGTICFLNPVWQQYNHIEGVPHEAFQVGDTYLERVGVIFQISPDYCRLLSHGLDLVLTSQRDSIEVEYPYICRGCWYWFLVRITTCQQHEGAALIYHDITSACVHFHPTRNNACLSSAFKSPSEQKPHIGHSD